MEDLVNVFNEGITDGPRPVKKICANLADVRRLKLLILKRQKFPPSFSLQYNIFAKEMHVKVNFTMESMWADEIPNWLLRDYADLFAFSVTKIIDVSF